MLDHWLLDVVTGLFLVVMGLLLSLPIPFTNYALAAILLLFALALLERDGALMLVAWIASAATIAGFGALSGTALQAVLDAVGAG
jgi:hypothetical protein